MIKKSLIINGVQRFLLVDEKETLASVLRERLLLTGCKSAVVKVTVALVT